MPALKSPTSAKAISAPATATWFGRVTFGLLAGGSALALVAISPAPPAHAQLKPDTAQLGRAPLSFADVVDRVKPSVVSISVTSGGQKVARNGQGPGAAPGKRGAPGAPGGQGRELMPNLPDDHPLKKFFDELPKDFGGGPGGPGGQQPRQTQSQGSGFVISEDGYVVTNNHVIDGGTKITVAFDENAKYPAKLIGTDPRTDLALLKIEAPGKTFPAVKFATKMNRVGDWVLAVGNPFGLGGTVTAGIVSALGRDIGSGPYDFLQIDAAVNRGNSGGPTFNLDGEVIGVNTAIYSPSGGNVGIAFAVPAKTAIEVIAQLQQSGTVSRGWLGVKIQNVDEDTAESLGMKGTKGAMINEVTPAGPAAAAGLRSQDTILSVNGATINDSRDLARKVAEFTPDTAVDVKVLRGGKEENIKVKLGKFPGAEQAVAKVETPEPKAAEIGSLGLGFSTTPVKGAAKEGLVIAEVDPNSDAAAKGIAAGDIVLEINSAAVTTAADFEATVKKAKEGGRAAVLLSVKSGDQKRVVPVKIVAKK
jgi:serine protease Do